jgi:hypothetical protein
MEVFVPIGADRVLVTASPREGSCWQAADGARAFAQGMARRSPEGIAELRESSAWYQGYDDAAAKVPGTMQHEAAQRLKLFPLGSRVKVVGYDKRLADAPRLNGRSGVVARGHFGGVYVLLDPRPRETKEKVELITWRLGETPALELLRDAIAARK